MEGYPTVDGISGYHYLNSEVRTECHSKYQMLKKNNANVSENGIKDIE
jgi:hypothetical protein